LVAWCNNGLNDEQIAEAAWQQGVEVAPISAYVMGSPIRGGLVLGYGMLKPEEIRTGVQKLAGVFTSGC
jgi:DNA-binding transcriptional MocR family regulator